MIIKSSILLCKQLKMQNLKDNMQCYIGAGPFCTALCTNSMFWNVGAYVFVNLAIIILQKQNKELVNTVICAQAKYCQAELIDEGFNQGYSFACYIIVNFTWL